MESLLKVLDEVRADVESGKITSLAIATIKNNNVYGQWSGQLILLASATTAMLWEMNRILMGRE